MEQSEITENNNHADTAYSYIANSMFDNLSNIGLSSGTNVKESDKRNICMIPYSGKFSKG